MKKLVLAFTLLICALAQASSPLTVDQGFVRGLPPGQSNTAAFMVISNTSNNAITLVGASTSVAASAAFHGHSEENGVMKMRHIPELVIDAGQKIELKPGGLHLMLMGLKAPLKDGNQVTINIEQKNGQSLEISLPVHSVLNEPEHHHHH
jgi:copper(I)-binding protein